MKKDANISAANLPAPSNCLELYLSQLNMFPVLSREQEHMYAVKYYKDKELDSAHKLVTSNLRFVVKIALEYRSYGLKLADLVQEGNIGLMVAVKKFNPYKGYRLITYAVWWIRSYIQSFILRSWSLVRRGGRELRKRLFCQLDKTRDTLERLDSKDDRQAHLGKERMKASFDRRDTSLDEVLVEGETTTRVDLLSDSSPNQEELIADDEEMRIVKRNLTTALAKLNTREKYVIEERIMRERPVSLQVIGDILGLTRERIRQIEGEALKKLRRGMPVDASGLVPD